jgi:hypothetical protein
MPAKSAKQAKYMRACAHNWNPTKGKCPPKEVARKFMSTTKENKTWKPLTEDTESIREIKLRTTKKKFVGTKLGKKGQKPPTSGNLPTGKEAAGVRKLASTNTNVAKHGDMANLVAAHDEPKTESRRWKPVVSEATDDMGRTIPGSAADGNSKTIGKFRSQPGAGPGQAKRNALAKKEAEAKAKTANEARGIGGRWDRPSQKYSDKRMQQMAGSNGPVEKPEKPVKPSTSEKPKIEGQQRLKRQGDAMIKRGGGILKVSGKAIKTHFKKERANQVSGDNRNTGDKVRASLGTPEGEHRMARKRDQHESTEHQISQLDTSTPVGAARAKELKIKQKARRLDAKDKAKGQIQGYKVDDKGRPAKGGAVKPASAADARAAQKPEDVR